MPPRVFSLHHQRLADCAVAAPFPILRCSQRSIGAANDSDLERFRQRLLEDADFEMLFHPEFDGIDPISSSGPK